MRSCGVISTILGCALIFLTACAQGNVRDPAGSSAQVTPSAAATVEDRYVDQVLGSPGLSTTLSRADLLTVGRVICEDTPHETPAELHSFIGGKYGSAAADVLIAAAQRNLCPYAVYVSAAPTEPSAANEASPTAEPSIQVITYEVTGVARAGNITYIKDNSFGQEQANNVKLPWSKNITFDASESFKVLSLVAQSASGGNGSIRCRILRDGIELTSSTSSGPYAVVSCAVS
jgi:Mycobacterium membrane protein